MTSSLFSFRRVTGTGYALLSVRLPFTLFGLSLEFQPRPVLPTLRTLRAFAGFREWPLFSF